MITVVRVVETVDDPESGVSTPVTRRYTIKAVVLPEDRVSKHLYNAAYLSMARNFVKGAVYDEVATPVIIKAKRLPSIILTTDDYCMIDGIRYDFRVVQRTPDQRAFYILTQQSPGVEG